MSAAVDEMVVVSGEMGGEVGGFVVTAGTPSRITQGNYESALSTLAEAAKVNPSSTLGVYGFFLLLRYHD